MLDKSTHHDRPINEDEKIVRDYLTTEAVLLGYSSPALDAFNRLMASAPQGKMKSAEKWADEYDFSKIDKDRPYLIDILRMIQNNAFASRTAMGDGVLREALTMCDDWFNKHYSKYLHSEMEKSITEALSAAPTHEAPSVPDGLLPCPWCKGAASIEEISSKISLGDKVSFSPGCSTEGCLGYQCFQTFARRLDAAKAWNTRAVSAKPPVSA